MFGVFWSIVASMPGFEAGLNGLATKEVLQASNPRIWRNHQLGWSTPEHVFHGI